MIYLFQVKNLGRLKIAFVTYNFLVSVYSNCLPNFGRKEYLKCSKAQVCKSIPTKDILEKVYYKFNFENILERRKLCPKNGMNSSFGFLAYDPRRILEQEGTFFPPVLEKKSILVLLSLYFPSVL